MTEPVVLFDTLPTANGKRFGVATLNAPASLNSLSVDMVRLLTPRLREWAADPQVVGVLLVFSLMVGPPAAAQRLTHRVGTGLALSAALALGSAWLGIALAYWTDWPCSFWITTLSCIAYLATTIPRRSHP